MGKKLNLKDLQSAIEIVAYFNRMSLDDFVLEVEESTGRKIDKDAVIDFRLMGLNNRDFLRYIGID